MPWLLLMFIKKNNTIISTVDQWCTVLHNKVCDKETSALKKNKKCIQQHDY